ncbi:hypothetical protein [Methylomonas methanica]|uniref:Uncharacterized protein n=1 Tax=Methylomonas methanica TaxID=421 RepID=A0A177LSJ6_METMH|nr:hypothetical protein [Methylomonas methanica]OAH96213.1 hypothetical protein A1332_23160 [Methylomonas methanica]
MSYFLWVEDFENDAFVTAEQVFGGVLNKSSFDEKPVALKQQLRNQGVFLELDLQAGLDFITKELSIKIDYAILDIDLKAHDGEINSDFLKLLADFENYQPHEDEAEDDELRKQACLKLKSIAGFYLYTKLVDEIGFPKQHILFCSNHGDKTEGIKEAFNAAKIALPEIYGKSDPYVQTWIRSCYNNPYSRLRRGIIEACTFLKDKKLRFNQYGADDKKPVDLDIENYLEILKLFLPLREPADIQSMYKLFVRTLAHEWDEAVKPRKLDKTALAFSWIMKMTRNWSAHTRVFDRLKAKDVAFLFIVNMRAMFDLGGDSTPYEKHLLSLFDQTLSVDEFRKIFGTSHKDRKIPLTQKYALLIDKYGKNYEASNFHDLLNEFQKKQSGNEDFLMQGLYQVFWFLTSNGFVYIDTHKIQDQKYLNYNFAYFNYAADEYSLEFGRHIYNTSFLQA